MTAQFFMKGKIFMNASIKKYQQKCKRRTITFYLHEKELYEYSKKINFNKFVKEQLKDALDLEIIRTYIWKGEK